MTSEQIRRKYEKLSKQISDTQKAIEQLREKCPHINTEEGTYSYRVGCYQIAIICLDCGKLIKYRL